jgi:hypothetical protein
MPATIASATAVHYDAPGRTFVFQQIRQKLRRVKQSEQVEKLGAPKVTLVQELGARVK